MDIAYGFSKALNGAQIAARLTGNALVLRDGDLTIVGSADATKVLAFSLAGNTTGKTLTLAPNQTTNQTLNIPNITATDTLATLGLAQTFSGAQTFSAQTRITNTTGSTSTLTGALIVSGGAGFAGGIYVGALSFFGAGTNNINVALNGGNTNANDGCGLFFQNAGSNVMAIGNKSSVVGGAYDSTGFVNALATLQLATANTVRMSIASTGIVMGTDPGGSDLARIGGALTISDTKLMTTKTSFTNGAAAAAGTLTNAPAAGNPTKWIPINDNGTTRYIPAW